MTPVFEDLTHKMEGPPQKRGQLGSKYYIHYTSSEQLAYLLTPLDLGNCLVGRPWAAQRGVAQTSRIRSTNIQTITIPIIIVIIITIIVIIIIIIIIIIINHRPQSSSFIHSFYVIPTDFCQSMVFVVNLLPPNQLIDPELTGTFWAWRIWIGTAHITPGVRASTPLTPGWEKYPKQSPWRWTLKALRMFKVPLGGIWARQICQWFIQRN